MSDRVINDEVRIGYPLDVGTTIKNTLFESYSGREQIFNNRTHDRKDYTINTSAMSITERRDLMDFFNDHNGMEDTFLFEDPNDNFVVREQIGEGDNSETQFQLSQSEKARWNILSTPVDVKIWVDDVELGSGYSIDYTDSGIVTFSSPPGSTLVIEAEYYFQRRVRFLVERLNYSVANYNNMMLSGLTMREILITV